MKRWMIYVVVLCIAMPSVAAPNNERGDIQTFELTPSAPSTDYWLLCNPRQRVPGNAAVLYADAAALLNDQVVKQVIDALSACRTSDWETFDSLANQLDQNKAFTGNSMQAVLDLLNVAACRDYCDWSSSLREQGVAALLPLLNGERCLAGLIEVRALEQIRGGKFDDAVRTLRLGFELGQKVGTEGVLVSGLMGVGIIAETSEATADLMQQAQAPNLYWALASLPRPMINMQHAFAFEMQWAQDTFHELAEDRIEELSGDTWRTIFQQAISDTSMSLVTVPGEKPAWANEQRLADAVMRTLPQAREYFANTYHLPAAQAAALDPYKVVGTYWYGQEQKQAELAYSMFSLPYPILLEKIKELDRRTAQLQAEQPANVFLAVIPKFTRAVTVWPRLERTLNAMTDVEAIRSYAAAHGGELAGSLDQITDTPALDNPRTGKPFDYVVRGDTATLSDLGDANFPLKYTIRIRK